MQKHTIAVIIPCLDEELTIASVIQDYHKALPEAEIYVYDNDSTDHTAQQAVKAGAKIRFCTIPGKGAVLRQAFHEVNADIYVLTDGDGTYPPTMVQEMLRLYMENPKSIVIGKRKNAKKHAVMSCSHAIGNRFLSVMFHVLYGFENIDVLSGSRIMGRDFVKSFPHCMTGLKQKLRWRFMPGCNILTYSPWMYHILIAHMEASPKSTQCVMVFGLSNWHWQEERGRYVSAKNFIFTRPFLAYSRHSGFAIYSAYQHR